MWITQKQINYITALLERSADRRLDRLWSRVKRSAAKVGNVNVDYRRVTVNEALQNRMPSGEAGHLIWSLLNPTDANVREVERVLLTYNVIN